MVSCTWLVERSEIVNCGSAARATLMTDQTTGTSSSRAPASKRERTRIGGRLSNPRESSLTGSGCVCMAVEGIHSGFTSLIRDIREYLTKKVEKFSAEWTGLPGCDEPRTVQSGPFGFGAVTFIPRQC